MAEYLTNTTDLTKVATAIREKGGTSDSLVYPDGFVTAIQAIQTGTELQIIVSVTSGATVTATKGSKVVSGTSVNGTCTLTVPEAGTWSVKATLNGQTSDTKSVSVVDSYAVALTFFSATITVNVDSGASVTLKKGGTTIATKTSNGTAVFTVTETGEYTVEATKNDHTHASGTVNVVSSTTSYTLTLILLNDNFADNDWSAIIAACHSGSVPSTWVVGNSKTMTIHGRDYKIDIIGKNHDTYTAGGTAPMTFQMHDCYAEAKKMNSSATNSGGWTSCAMRQEHLPAILALMPTEVQNGIREVNKLTSAGSQSSTINTTADKLFLLSEIEIFGSTTCSKSGEGSQYAYYSAGNSIPKTQNGTWKQWFERSPYGSSSTDFCMVNDYGQAGKIIATNMHGVAFGFCF